MKNSTNALNVSTLFCLLSFFAFSQEQNKYTRKNENAPIVKYSSEKCYARTIIVDNGSIYSGNSDGSLWKTSLNDSTSVNLMANKNFGEMRDLAFCDQSLIGMQSAENGLLVKTSKQDFDKFISPLTSSWNGVFFDGIDFFNSTGFLFGDPKNGQFSLFLSEDCGNNWTNCIGQINANDGEMGFAASGKNTQLLNDSTFLFISGGKKSRFFKSTNKGKSWVSASLPFFTSESSGAFSLCFQNELIGVVVGGDYANPSLNKNCCYYTEDGGKFWVNSEKQPRGYRSCVVEKNDVYYCCGTNGIDFSVDHGKTWKAFANGNFFSMTTDQNHLFATTINGSFQYFDLIKN